MSSCTVIPNCYRDKSRGEKGAPSCSTGRRGAATRAAWAGHKGCEPLSSFLGTRDGAWHGVKLTPEPITREEIQKQREGDLSDGPGQWSRQSPQRQHFPPVPGSRTRPRIEAGGCKPSKRREGGWGTDSLAVFPRSHPHAAPLWKDSLPYYKALKRRWPGLGQLHAL